MPVCHDTFEAGRRVDAEGRLAAVIALDAQQGIHVDLDDLFRRFGGDRLDVDYPYGDDRLATLVSEREVPVILMHMQGTPGSMQVDPTYDDLIGEIKGFLNDAV